MKIFKYFSLILISGFSVFIGCSSSDTITLSGVVINIDTFAPADEVRVSVLDSNLNAIASSTAATATDGVFSVKIPKSALPLTPVWIETSNFNGSNDWFPFINVDPALNTINGDTEMLIHACPAELSSKGWATDTTVVPGTHLGSVAVWDRYLASTPGSTKYPNRNNVFTTKGVVSGLFFMNPAN